MSGKAVKKFTAFLFVAPANLFERRRKQKRWSAKPTFPDSNSLHGRRRQAGERRSARSARVNPREGGGQPEPSRAQRHRRRTPPRRQERGPRDRAASRSPRPYSGRSAIIVVSTLQTVPIAVCNSSRRCGPSFRHAPYASPAPAARCRSARSRNKESNELVSNGLLIRPMKMETKRVEKTETGCKLQPVSSPVPAATEALLDPVTGENLQ